MIVITILMVLMSNKKKQHSLQNDNHYWAIMSIMGNKQPFLGGDFFSQKMSFGRFEKLHL